MAPTQDEELKLRVFSGNPAQLTPADRFLKAIVDIPCSFKRMEALIYMGTLQEDVTSTRDSFAILEVYMISKFQFFLYQNQTPN